VFEGTITDADAIPLIKEILTEAKEDEIIKSLFAQWTEDTEEELYEEFQEEIDELLENAEKETADGIEDETEESYSLQSRIWVDDSGAAVGRDISIVDSYGSYITLSSKAPKDGDNCGYQLCLDSDGTSVSLEGSGVLDGTLLSGNYELSVSGQSMINVEVADYDTEAAKDGNICGNYTLSLLPGITDDEDTYAALSGFSVILTLKDEGNSGLIGLNLAASGVSIGTISMEAVTQDTELEIPDFAGFSDVYDFNNEEEMNAYTATISLDVVVQNLLDAGMPETFIQEMINAAGGETTEEVWDASEGTEVVVSDAA
jgi:hypothetical protein